MKIIRGGVVGLAVVVGAGVLAWPSATALADTEEFYKRDERSVELYAAADDDLDDTNDRMDRNGDSRGDTNSADGTGDSRSRADGTRSNVTGVSRDRDRSSDGEGLPRAHGARLPTLRGPGMSAG